MHENLHKIRHKVDLCVVGGGLSGVCAAISAARNGIKVVLMHDRPTLGGNASSEIRMWVCGADGKNNRETGIIEEIALENLYTNPLKNPYLFDAILYDKVIKEPNLTLLLNCSCLDAEMKDEKTILSVTGWQGTTQQYHIVEASLFADCSGDSILAPLASAEFRMGREAESEFGEQTVVKVADKKTMGISCLLQARLEDKPSRFTAPDFALKLTDEDVAKRRPSMDKTYENFWYLELGGEEDCIGDTESIRDRLLALAMGYWDYVKNSGTVANADYWKLEFVGFLPAKRESRRMVGDHILTQCEVSAGGMFEDTVAFGGWGLDDHYPGGFFYKGAPNTCPLTPSPYGIPYRCLYSRNIGNLFFAGRNISATHTAMSSTRVMATCAIMGEAVGAAASICVKRDCSPRDITTHHINELQQGLIEVGCFVPNFVRQVSTLTKNARLTATGLLSGELDALRNGTDRNNRIYGDEEQSCSIALESELAYEFDEADDVSAVRLTFDSDLDRLTLPGDHSERTHMTRANLFPTSPVMHMPTTLVKSYEIYAEDGAGERTLIFKEECNKLRTANIKVGKKAKKIIFVPREKWETDDRSVCLFSFDVK